MKNILGIILLVASGFTFAQSKSELILIADEINKSLPMRIDSMTRFDNVSVVGEKAIQYTMTVLTMNVSEFNSSVINSLHHIVATRACSTPGTRELLDGGIIFTWFYRDKNNTYITTLPVNKAICKKTEKINRERK